MYVAGTASALAATAIKPSSPCRGRCLLEEDGMVEIDSPANEWNTTSLLDIPLANLTNFVQVVNSTSISTSNLSKNNDSLPFRFPPDFPLPKTLQASPILNCPCNCTYVSAACCISRIVWEEPSKQILMEPPPSDASVCCNARSGKWEPKSQGCGASNEGLTGFISLGSVKENNRTAPHGKVKGSQPKL